MRLTFNIRHLEQKNLYPKGELAANELELEGMDEMIQVTDPVEYDLSIERLSQSVLVQGRLAFTLHCECVRCLAPFEKRVELDEWSLDLPLTGEERVVIENDSVDLTPWIREDILLAFPQHPLCHAECRGLLNAPLSKNQPAIGAGQRDEVSSAWAELNKLKL